MEEKRNVQLQAVCVAAGALAVMAASLDRAAVVYSIVKQWRAWVFVVLNILLLAILFTSRHAAFCSEAESDDVKDDDKNCFQECDDVDDSRKKRIRKQEEQRHCRREIAEEDGGGGDIDRRCKIMKSSEKKDVEEEEEEKVIECEVSEKSRPMPLSNEELNERVEAFIATFRRQHLVSDVKGKSRSGVYSSPAKNGVDILSKCISV